MPQHTKSRSKPVPISTVALKLLPLPNTNETNGPGISIAAVVGARTGRGTPLLTPITEDGTRRCFALVLPSHRTGKMFGKLPKVNYLPHRASF